MSQQPSAVPPNPEVKEFPKPMHEHHVYGSKAAFQIYTTTTKTKETPTVQFDFAESIGERNYNWQKDEKLIFQCTPPELVELVSLLLGAKLEVRFNFHNDKAMQVKWQPDGNITISCKRNANETKPEIRRTVAISTMHDRMSVLNAALYALAKGQQISITEARTQVLLMNRPVSRPQANSNSGGSKPQQQAAG